jgi:hypothetical protein
MMLWPTKKQPINENNDSLHNNTVSSQVNTNSIPTNPQRTMTPNNNYLCPAPQSYNPQYPISNPWYVTPQMQSNSMQGQSFYPQQSQLPNNFDYSQSQYYLPNYRFRNPNNNSQNNSESNYNNNNVVSPSYSPFNNWNDTSQLPSTINTTPENNPPRYVPPQFQGGYYPGY